MSIRALGLIIGLILIHNGRRIRLAKDLGDWVLGFVDDETGYDYLVLTDYCDQPIRTTIDWMFAEKEATRHCHGQSDTGHAPVTPPVTRTVTAKTGRDGTEEERRSSVANATGASPPKIDDPQPSVFDTGVALLVRTGSKPKPARGLIAKWIRATDEDWTLRALASAEGRADPVSWIEAKLKSHKSVEDEARAISHATAERYRRMAIPGPPVGNRVGEAIVG